MATTNTAAAKQAGKAAAKSPKVAKVVTETAAKEGFTSLASRINGTNVAILALGAAAAVATHRLRELYLATKAKADNPETDEPRRSQA